MALKRDLCLMQGEESTRPKKKQKQSQETAPISWTLNSLQSTSLLQAEPQWNKLSSQGLGQQYLERPPNTIYAGSGASAPATVATTYEPSLGFNAAISQEENVTSRDVHGGLQSRSYHGSSSATTKLDALLHRGFQTLATPMTSGLSMLFALEISLRAADWAIPRPKLSLSSIFAAYYGSQFKTIAKKHFENGECDESIQDMENMGTSQLKIVAEIVAQQIQCPIELVVVTASSGTVSGPTGFALGDDQPLRVEDAFISTGELIGYDWRRTVTIALYKTEEAGRVQWMGIGPSNTSVQDKDFRGLDEKFSCAWVPPKTHIDRAPWANTKLPLEFMAGITTQELILFFPNHVMYWPAITARVIADGYTYARVANLIAEYYSDNHPKRSSIAYVMNAQCQEFYGANWSFEAYRMEPVENKRPLEDFLSIPWTRTERSADLVLHPPWNLWKIANLIPNTIVSQHDGVAGLASETAMVRLPGDGPFTRLLERALQYRPLAAAVRSTEDGEVNPPLFPPGWAQQQIATGLARPPTSGRSKRRSSKKRAREDEDEDESSPQRRMLSRTIASSSDDPFKARDEILSKTTQPLEIIERFPNELHGEMLIWMMSKNGGRLETVELTRLVRSVLRGHGTNIRPEFVNEDMETACQLEGMILPTRSTFSKRKEMAIKSRAKREGVSVGQAFAECEKNIWHGHSNATPHKRRQDRKAPDGSSLRQPRKSRARATNARTIIQSPAKEDDAEEADQTLDEPCTPLASRDLLEPPRKSFSELNEASQRSGSAIIPTDPAQIDTTAQNDLAENDAQPARLAAHNTLHKEGEQANAEPKNWVTDTSVNFDENWLNALETEVVQDFTDNGPLKSTNHFEQSSYSGHFNQIGTIEQPNVDHVYGMNQTFATSSPHLNLGGQWQLGAPDSNVYNAPASSHHTSAAFLPSAQQQATWGTGFGHSNTQASNQPLQAQGSLQTQQYNHSVLGTTSDTLWNSAALWFDGTMGTNHLAGAQSALSNTQLDAVITGQLALAGTDSLYQDAGFPATAQGLGSEIGNTDWTNFDNPENNLYYQTGSTQPPGVPQSTISPMAQSFVSAAQNVVARNSAPRLLASTHQPPSRIAHTPRDQQAQWMLDNPSEGLAFDGDFDNLHWDPTLDEAL